MRTYHWQTHKWPHRTCPCCLYLWCVLRDMILWTSTSPIPLLWLSYWFVVFQTANLRKICEIWKYWINNDMMKKQNRKEYSAYLHQPAKSGIKLWDLAVWCKLITNIIQTLKPCHVANLRNICDKIIRDIQCITLKNNQLQRHSSATPICKRLDYVFLFISPYIVRFSLSGIYSDRTTPKSMLIKR